MSCSEENLRKLRGLLTSFANWIRDGDGTNNPVLGADIRDRVNHTQLTLFSENERTPRQLNGYTRKSFYSDPSVPENEVDYFRKLLTDFSNRVNMYQKYDVDTLISKSKYYSGIEFVDDSKYIVKIPNYFNRIQAGAFDAAISPNKAEYKKVVEFIIPNSISIIDNLAFRNCESLERFDFKKVSQAGSDLFANCTNLQEITFSPNMTTIETRMFYCCPKLTSITIPNNITTIKKEAFSGTGLTNLQIPSSVTTIGLGNTAGCNNLASITIDSNYYYYTENNCLIKTAEQKVIAGCKNSIIPNDVTSIDEDAFGGIKTLTSITIPANVTSIGKEAFAESGLQSVQILGNTSLGIKSFYNCEGLVSVSLSNTLTTIGERAFQHCTALETINWPSALQTIEQQAFESCTALTSIVLPEGVKTIGPSAFSSCSSLASITFPSTLQSLGYNAFYNCSLTNIDLSPTSITYIGDWTFNSCESLAQVTLPNNLTTIGYNAFSQTALTRIEIQNTIEYIEEDAFSLCDNLYEDNIYVHYNGYYYDLPYDTSWIENVLSSFYHSDYHTLHIIDLNGNDYVADLDDLCGGGSGSGSGGGSGSGSGGGSGSGSGSGSGWGSGSGSGSGW